MLWTGKSSYDTMEEAHTILHQITALLGIKQCTATQVLGICLEFWVGAAVTGGGLKIKQLYSAKKQLEKIKEKKKPKKKTKVYLKLMIMCYG